MPYSRMRVALYASLSATMLLLAWLAKLSLLQCTALIVISIIVAVYIWLSKPALRHLSQPPLNQRPTGGWQLLMRTARGEALWQAELCTVHHYGWLLHFEFVVVEPYQRPLSVTVFRDQVAVDDWQSLNVLAHVTAGHRS